MRDPEPPRASRGSAASKPSGALREPGEADGLPDARARLLLQLEPERRARAGRAACTSRRRRGRSAAGACRRPRPSGRCRARTARRASRPSRAARARARSTRRRRPRRRRRRVAHVRRRDGEREDVGPVVVARRVEALPLRLEPRRVELGVEDALLVLERPGEVARRPGARIAEPPRPSSVVARRAQREVGRIARRALEGAAARATNARDSRAMWRIDVVPRVAVVRGRGEIDLDAATRRARSARAACRFSQQMRPPSRRERRRRPREAARRRPGPRRAARGSSARACGAAARARRRARRRAACCRASPRGRAR